MAGIRLVNTATLLRGQTYTVRHVKFEKGKAKTIDDAAFLKQLEEDFDEVTDGEGEVFEKPRFLIKRNVAPPEESDGHSVRRLSATRTMKVKPIRPRV